MAHIAEVHKVIHETAENFVKQLSGMTIPDQQIKIQEALEKVNEAGGTIYRRMAAIYVTELINAGFGRRHIMDRYHKVRPTLPTQILNAMDSVLQYYIADDRCLDLAPVRPSAVSQTPPAKDMPDRLRELLAQCSYDHTSELSEIERVDRYAKTFGRVGEVLEACVSSGHSLFDMADAIMHELPNIDRFLSSVLLVKLYQMVARYEQVAPEEHAARWKTVRVRLRYLDNVYGHHCIGRA